MMNSLSKISIEKIFIILAFVFGLTYLIITPPFQSVDEHFHFYRAYGISQNQVLAEKQNMGNQIGYVGNKIPLSICELTVKFSRLIKNKNEKVSVNELKEASKIKLDKNNKVFANFPNTALYSPIPYIAQSIGIKTAEIINLNPFWYVYFGRFFNLILYCLLGFLALKTIPTLKTGTFLILLSPMALSLGASLSTDALIISSSLLFFSIILKTLCDDKKIDNITVFYLSILSAVLALSKHNFFLLPLIFLISKDKFGKNYFVKIIAIFAPAIVFTMVWSKMISGLYTPLNPQADMYTQINFILHNPLKFIGVILATVLIKTLRLIVTGIGILGWQDTRLDFLTYILYPIMFFGAIFCEKLCIILKKWQNILLCAVLIISYIIIVTYMYLSWSPVGANIVTGLNGKYFFPLVLPAMFLVKNLIKKDFCIANYQTIIYSLSFLILLSSVFSIVERFYL